MSRSDCSDDSLGVFEGKRRQCAFPPEKLQRSALDSELASGSENLQPVYATIPTDVRLVDTGFDGPPFPTIHNAFFIPGKVPSLNELLDAKSKNQPRLRSIIMRERPSKGQNWKRFSVYNDVKKDWEARTIRALGSSFTEVQHAYFGYVVVEDTCRRDPSNICSAAVKFIEDGLVLAGAIPDDGWDEVLGIRVQWLHRKGRPPGIYVVMSAGPIDENDLMVLYEVAFSRTSTPP